jgi:hypothetical protein
VASNGTISRRFSAPIQANSRGVERAGYTEDVASPYSGDSQAQASPRVRIRTPQDSQGNPPDSLRRLVSDDRAIDILDLPPARGE